MIFFRSRLNYTFSINREVSIIRIPPIQCRTFEKFVSLVQIPHKRSYVITHNFRFEKYMVCTDASVSTASTIDPGPVINYTGYLNNFPINAERHLVRLNFSNLRLTYLLTYSPHDKTNEALAKLSEAWKFEIEFARERERERERERANEREREREEKRKRYIDWLSLRVDRWNED